MVLTGVQIAVVRKLSSPIIISHYEWIDITDNDEAIAYIEELNDGNRSIPTIIYPDGTVHVEPSNAELAEQTGVNQPGKP